MTGNLTDFGRLSTLRKKVWSAKIIMAGRDESFFLGEKGMMSSGLSDASKPVHFVDELTATGRGDKCVMPMILDLETDGVVDDDQLEGNEVPLVVDSAEIQLSQLRTAVKSSGKMSLQRTVFQFREQAKGTLGNWRAQKIDEIMFMVASGVSFTQELNGKTRPATSNLAALAFASDVTAPSANRAIYAGSATSTSNLTATDKMNYALLVRANTLAKQKRIKPMRIKGKATYVVLMALQQAYDLKNDNDYKTAVSRASNRGEKNELFTGAFASIDGLALYEHPKCKTTLGASTGSKYGSGGTVDGAQALLLGAQAVAYANIGDDTYYEGDNSDYGNRDSIAYGFMAGFLKPVFKSNYDRDSSNNPTSQDFGVLSIYTAITAIN
jgi:N4-gp56 family major capsid protein